jgi:pyrroloquinoline quinone biosynthesis protein B
LRKFIGLIFKEIKISLFKVAILILLLFTFSCNQSKHNKTLGELDSVKNSVYLLVLGTLQDGGAPHIGCKKDCCKDLFIHPDSNKKVVSLGVIDQVNKKNFIFEATPDFPVQLKNLSKASNIDGKELPDGIFLTHAHIGHYTGLMYLGKEAMNSKEVKVYAMERMKHFLEENGPWSQLVNIHNINLEEIFNEQTITLSPVLKVQPIKVPHRDEYSETIGFIIEGPKKKVLFIPDIDKWEKWDQDIIEMISKVDYAFLDGTFYDGDEIKSRNMAEIPHPFIIESMEKFKDLTKEEKRKIYFIHLNHTNPALDPDSKQSKIILDKGFNIARRRDIIKL